MAGRKYSNQKQKRAIFGGGKTHSGLFGLGSSDASMAKAKKSDREKKESDTRMRRMRTGDPDAPMSDLIKEK